MYDILELNQKLVSELKEIAKDLKIKRIETLRKQDLIYKILDQQAISATGDKVVSREKKSSEPIPQTKPQQVVRDNHAKNYGRGNHGDKHGAECLLFRMFPRTMPNRCPRFFC